MALFSSTGILLFNPGLVGAFQNRSWLNDDDDDDSGDDSDD